MSLITIPESHSAPAPHHTKTTANPLRNDGSSARRIFRTLHLVLGLSFGTLLVLQGLSGAALVWRPELDRLMVPALTHDAAPPIGTPSLDRELAAVRLAAPGAKIRALRFATSSRGADEWMVQPQPAALLGLSGKSGEGNGPRWTVYTSPATGRVLGIRGKQRDALQFLIDWHHNLLSGRLGRTILGYLAVSTILLSLSGLWLWWPAGWAPSRFRPRAAARPLHYAVGFWAMWPLLTIATTATYFVWREPIDRAFGVPTTKAVAAVVEGAQAADSARPKPHHDNPPPTKLMAAAQATEPSARFVQLRFPEGLSGTYTATFDTSREDYRDGPNSVTLRVVNGDISVVKVWFWRDGLRARRWLGWLPRIHQAEFGGEANPIARALWSATGLMPAVLFVSGLLMWRRRLAASAIKTKV